MSVKNGEKIVTVAIIVIGNEILSGQVRDSNMGYLAIELSKIGIKLLEVRIIRDEEIDIINTVRDLKDKYNYIFTSGGIGPTHDDITTESIAKALELKLCKDENVVKNLEKYYDNVDLSDPILKMALIPEGAELIPNELTTAPGYKIENIFVLAGMPEIMKVMFEATKSFLDLGAIINSKIIRCCIQEDAIATYLGDLQNKFKESEIGSYPFLNHKKQKGTDIVIKAYDEAIIEDIVSQLQQKLENLNRDYKLL